MFITGIKAIVASSLAVWHFGPHDNVRVEAGEQSVRVTAYGPAAFVPMQLGYGELRRCVLQIESCAGHCEFGKRGTIDARKVGDGMCQWTFADSLHANVVDIDLDEPGLARALATLRSIL